MTAIEQTVFDFKAYYSDNPWFGDSYLDVISDITPSEALATPPNQHSIAVLLWHMVKWRKSLTERLLGNSDFQANVSDSDNWPSAISQSTETWEAAKMSFTAQQKIIVEELSKRDEEFMDMEFIAGRNYRRLVTGVLQHDIYHLGQVAFVKSLIRKHTQWH